MPQLTPQEIEAIRKEAEELYPFLMADANFKNYYETMLRIRRYQRAAYITAATAYVLRAKGLVDALEDMVDVYEQYLLGKNLHNPDCSYERAKLAVNNYNQNKES